MALLTVQQIDLDGEVLDLAAAAGGGDTFVNNGRTYLHVNNGGGGAITVTIDSVQNCNQGFDHNAGAAVAAGAQTLFGPFPKARFGTTTSVTYTGVTSVTVGVFSI